MKDDSVLKTRESRKGEKIDAKIRPTHSGPGEIGG